MGMTHALTISLTNLEALIDEANAAMKAGMPIDDAAMAAAKGRALLALSRATHLDPAAPGESVLRDTIRRIKDKLEEERTLLSRRLQAAEVIADLVAEALLERDWDGTYEAPVPALAPVRRRP